MIRLFARLSFGCLLAVLVAGSAHAQWLNYKTPGVPRKADGSPNLSAPPPKFFDGRPDLTGVWLHDLTPIDELKRLFGAAMVDGEIQTQVPGMEFGNVHKYALDVLIDFPPNQSPARPEAIRIIPAGLRVVVIIRGNESVEPRLPCGPVCAGGDTWSTS